MTKNKKIKTEEILVSEACFRQQVNLPVSQVSGLTEAELSMALAFETEPFSGMSRRECEMAWTMKPSGNPERRIYDVVQIGKGDLEKAFAQAKREKRRIRGVTATPDFAAGETLEEMPVIERGKTKIEFGALTVWFGVCVLAAAGLLCEWGFAKNRNVDLGKELAFREMLHGKMNRLETEEKSIRAEIRSIREAREKAAAAQERVAALRSSWKVLLEAVSLACGGESVVKKISKTDAPYKARIEGVALSSGAAGRTLRRLTEHLRSGKSDWRVSPGEIISAPSGGSATFSCDVVFETDEKR